MAELIIGLGLGVIGLAGWAWYTTPKADVAKRLAIQKALEEQSKKTKCRIVFKVNGQTVQTKFIEPFNLGDMVMTPDASALAVLSEFYSRGYFSAEDGKTYPASKIEYAYVVKDVKEYQ